MGESISFPYFTYVTVRVSVVVSLGQIWADFFPAKLKN